MQKSGIWGEICRPFAMGVAAGVIVLLLPLLVVGESAGAEPPQLLPTVPPASMAPEPSPTPEPWDSTQTLRVLLESGEVEELTMEEYLWRVVAAEMPATFEEEALRAQAVCARTYTLWKMAAGSHREDGADICDDSACCQAYIAPEEAAERWLSRTETYTARIADAVADTDGCILTYDNQPIQAVFFSSSTDSTEDAAAVWGSGLPYLVSVDSPEGEEVPNYRSTVTLTAEEVRALMAEKYPGADLSGDTARWFDDITYTASGRVAELELGRITLSGGAARTLLGLRSTCFTVEEAEGVFTISVTGYGHGVGMSQYGANAMAEAGSSWEDIVTHYYTGITIHKQGE